MKPARGVPGFAVIFISTLKGADPGYGETLARMKELGYQQPGFLGLESARGPDGRGITVVFYESAEAARAWGRHPEHRAAQQAGREKWYDNYEMYYANLVDGKAWSTK